MASTAPKNKKKNNVFDSLNDPTRRFHTEAIPPAKFSIPADSKTKVGNGSATPAEDDPDAKTVRFPTRIHLLGLHEDYTGEVAGILFTDGLSRDYLSFRRVNGFTAGFGAALDFRTGCELHPLKAGKGYLIDNTTKAWEIGRPLPQWVVDEMPPAPVFEEVEVEEEEYEDEEDEVIDPVAEVTAPAAGNAFEIPVVAATAPLEIPSADDVAATQAAIKTILQSVAKKKGARFLKDVCVKMKLQDAREASEMIDTLIAGGLTLDDAKDLAEVKKAPDAPAKMLQANAITANAFNSETSKG